MPRDLLADYEEQQPIDLLSDEKDLQQQPSSDFLKNVMNFGKGAGFGLLQGAGDTAASIGNFPADIYEHFKGESPYHIPHPSLQSHYPEGMAGKIGSLLGEGIGQVAIPGTGVFKAAKAFNNPLVKALAGMAAGGLGGAASNEGDRIGSGITGAAVGTALPLAGSVVKGLATTPWTKGMASKSLKKAEKLVGERGISNISVPEDLFEESKDFLPKNLPNRKLLDAAKTGEYSKLFTLQSDLGKISRELKNSASGAERLHGFQAEDLRQRLLNSIKEHLANVGHEDISDLLSKGQTKYAQHMKYIHPITKQIPKTIAGTIGLGSGYEILKHLLK